MKIRNSAAVLCVAFATMLGAVPTAAVAADVNDAPRTTEATASDYSTIADDAITIYAPVAAGGNKFYDGSDLQQEFTSDKKPTPYMINPVKQALCKLGRQDTTIISYPSKYNGKVALKCGNSNSGYVHIRNRHANDWKGKMGGRGGSWDGFMSFATRAALNSPSFSRNQGGNKRCYVTPIVVVGKDGGKKTFWPRVTVSANNKIIITSFPTGGNKC